MDNTWKPPADQVTTNTSWKPPADAVVSAQGELDQPDSTMGQVAMEAAKSANATFTAPYTATKAMVNNPDVVRQQLPTAGAMIGGAFGGPAGMAAGAGLGQIGSRIAGMGYGTEGPSRGPLEESIAPMGQAALSGIFEVGGVKNVVQKAAQNLGRRALGFTKPMIKRAKGGIDTLNRSAQEMLDKGVIRPLSSAKSMLGRAEDVAETSGEAIGKTLKSSGNNAINTEEVASKVIDQLAPQFKGGAYDAQDKVVQEIVDTIGAHGNGPIDFESAQKLKTTLKQLAGNNWNTDKVKAAMYQRAYGIVNQAIEEGVEGAAKSGANLPVMQPGAKTGDPHALFAYNDDFGAEGTKRAIYNVYGDPAHPSIKARGFGSSVTKADLDKAGIPITGREPRAANQAPAGSMGDEVLRDYVRNKQTYGASQRAIEGLGDRAAAEASNSILSLRGAALAGGALATGDVTKALEALGAWEAARRVGAGTGAYAINALNKSPLTQGVRTALLTEFINRISVGKQ